MVSPAKGIWKDFSSGKGGTVVTFVMEVEHCSYPEAIRYIAKKYNIPIEETEVSERGKTSGRRTRKPVHSIRIRRPVVPPPDDGNSRRA